jgi:hypothetical protein
VNDTGSRERSGEQRLNLRGVKFNFHGAISSLYSVTSNRRVMKSNNLRRVFYFRERSSDFRRLFPSYYKVFSNYYGVFLNYYGASSNCREAILNCREARPCL